jgi:hypothetical protein
VWGVGGGGGAICGGVDSDAPVAAGDGDRGGGLIVRWDGAAVVSSAMNAATGVIGAGVGAGGVCGSLAIARCARRRLTRSSIRPSGPARKCSSGGSFAC